MSEHLRSVSELASLDLVGTNCEARSRSITDHPEMLYVWLRLMEKLERRNFPDSNSIESNEGH